jgi:hypothetical protein
VETFGANSKIIPKIAQKEATAMPTRSSAPATNVRTIAGTVRFLCGLAVFLGASGTLFIPPVVPARVPEACTSHAGGTPGAMPPVLRQAGGDASWWRTVTADLARREYEVSATPAGDLQAPNRGQNLRTIFGGGGIEVVPRTEKNVAPAWRFAWETRSMGREDGIEAAELARPEAVGSRVTYIRDGWSEWYENTVDGLEQGFTFTERPVGAAPLRIVGRITGAGALEPRAGEDGAIDFLDAHGARVIRYGELHARDADGTTLPSKLVVSGSLLAIEVDDSRAVYPLTIDPLITSPAWTAEGDQANANFGVSVASAGDVNGDGYGDVIVGARNFDNPQVNEGKVFVYHGSASGLSIVPNWTAEGDQTGAGFGCSVACAGDVNGDGFADVIVGAFDYDNGQDNEGRAFVYLGSALGLGASAAWTAESDQVGALFGWSAACAGDVNGDGFADVIIGAYSYDNGQSNEGRAYVYHGSTVGLQTSPAWTAESDQADADFGFSVSAAGDVNGDGFADVIVGAMTFSNGQSGEGRVFVYHGSPGGLSSAPAWTGESDQAGAFYGWSVSTAGDVNGDGYSDAIVGAISLDSGQENEGGVYVYKGSASGLGGVPWTAEGNQAFAEFGCSVGMAGDVNGDGYADVIVGADAYDNGQTNEGRAFVYQGSATGLPASPTWTAESDQGGSLFGTSVAAAGDVNGDGYSDVIMGAMGYDNGQTDEGRAFVYLGAPSGLSAGSGWFADGGQSDDRFGERVSTAGDVNGDGYSDVIVGAPLYDHGQTDEGLALVFLGSPDGLSSFPAWTAEGNQTDCTLGIAVGTAGDVNGDGFADVIVGADGYDHGQFREGAAFVYLGSAAGLTTTPAWVFEPDQANALMGTSVGCAGDVNGDGYSDVIVGSEIYDNGEEDEGRAYLFEGSSSGLSPTPAWIGEGDQTGARFGSAAGTAGDVNGDGFSDVIVGAPYYDNGEADEGRAYIYEGSAAGLSMTPIWIAEGNQSGATFGGSLGTAGDVNGDGYADVIVGALQYDDGQSQEGAAWVYMGAAGGPSTTPVWVQEGNQAGALYGCSVGTAGDVNGDGFSDVIVGSMLYDNGQTEEGRAYVYHGSVAGLAVAIAWMAEGDQTNAYFGYSVGTAGDVNGDGFSDVIVSALYYNNGQADGGRTFAYYGNGGDGLGRLPLQARTDGSRLIPLLGASDSGTAFRLLALGRSCEGRRRVRLQYELKPAGAPLDGTGLESGPLVDTDVPGATGSVVDLSELASGLTPATLYHWRLRTVTDSPIVPYSPWFGMTGNAWSEADLRTGGIPAGVDEDAAAGPERAMDPLGTPVPNPLVSFTHFTYTLSEGGKVRLGVYDATGREVTSLIDGVIAVGRHEAVWDGRDARGKEVRSGVYFLRLDRGDGGQIAVRKLVKVR